MSSFRDDAPPWSFFIPITLAVMVGVLAADAIRYAIGTVFGGDDAPGQVETVPDEAPVAPVAPEPAVSAPQAEMEPESGPGAGAGRADFDFGNGRGPDAAQVAPVADETPAASGVLELPDSMTARRDGDPAACVNGTVVNRVEGGWEQALENEAPIPCVIISH